MSQRVMIACWGSRGDLQPVASLAVGLKKWGRDVIVFATPPATDLFKNEGIECVESEENCADFVEMMFSQCDPSDRSIGGIMKLAKVAKAYMDSPEYIATQSADMESALAAAKKFKPDVIMAPNLIYGPYMCIAEALQVPVVTFDLQINYPTSELPLFTMEVGSKPQFMNSWFYSIKGFVYPKQWKPKFDMMREICGLPVDKYSDGSPFKVWPHDLPQICAVSPTLIPQPEDWPEETKFMSGWWFLYTKPDFKPPGELAAFLRAHKPVYIGFGSMKGNPGFCTKLSTLAITGLKLAGVKGVLLGGWAGLTRKTLDVSTEEGKELQAWAEKNVIEIDSCPHDWLFPQCSAVVHHGGAGTLAAGIRAGVPTIVCATQGDQPFHGSLLKARGIGEYLGMVGTSTVNAEALAEAIEEVTTDQGIIDASRAMGEQVRAEDGIGNAIGFIDEMAMSASYPWPIQASGKREAREPDEDDSGFLGCFA